MAERPKKDAVTVWTELADRLVAGHAGVSHGKMMSSDAVTFGGKVFAFYTDKGRFAGLGLRLGRDFDVEALKLADWEHLAPFKSRPPMVDWILVGSRHSDRWTELARLALKQMRKAAKRGK